MQEKQLTWQKVKNQQFTFKHYTQCASTTAGTTFVIADEIVLQSAPSYTIELY